MVEAARGLLAPAGLDAVTAVLFIIAAQVVLIGALLVWTVALRLVRHGRARRRRQLFTAWHYLVPSFLSGDLDEAFLRHSLRPRDYPLFAEFLRPYLVDLRGSDAALLSRFLTRLGFMTYLRRALRSRSPWRRAWAVHHFALIADPGARPFIRAALEDRAELVANQAAEALMRMQDTDSVEPVLHRLSGLSRGSREWIVLFLMEFGLEAMPVLQAMVRSADSPPWLMVMVLQVLAYHHYTPATWEILYLYLHPPDREVRIACVKALRACGEPTLVGFFEKMLQDHDPVVQAEAAKALGAVGDASHTAMLARLLESDDFWVLRNAVDALLRLEMLPWVILHPRYGRGRFSARARELIREALADHMLHRRARRVA